MIEFRMIEVKGCRRIVEYIAWLEVCYFKYLFVEK